MSKKSLTETANALAPYNSWSMSLTVMKSSVWNAPHNREQRKKSYSMSPNAQAKAIRQPGLINQHHPNLKVSAAIPRIKGTVEHCETYISGLKCPRKSALTFVSTVNYQLERTHLSLCPLYDHLSTARSGNSIPTVSRQRTTPRMSAVCGRDQKGATHRCQSTTF